MVTLEVLKLLLLLTTVEEVVLVTTVEKVVVVMPEEVPVVQDTVTHLTLLTVNSNKVLKDKELLLVLLHLQELLRKDIVKEEVLVLTLTEEMVSSGLIMMVKSH
jgi:hypothetical protein